MSRTRLRRLVGPVLLAALVLLAWPVDARPDPGPIQPQPLSPIVTSDGTVLTLRRLVLVQRHGVRSPLPSQIPPRTVLDVSWPSWSGGPGDLTPHGAEGMRLMGRWQRRMLAGAGLLPSAGCPAAGRLRVRSNSVPRAIDSARALVAGLAPGCEVPVGHLRVGTPDPLFEPALATPDRFDMAALLPRIVGQTGTPEAALLRADAALALLRRIAGCPGAGTLCDDKPRDSRLAVTPDGHGLVLTGLLDRGSAIAEAMMLAYLDGRPMTAVCWARCRPSDLGALSALHGAMLSMTSGAPALAEALSRTFRRSILADLAAPLDVAHPVLDVYVGHDDTIEPLLGVLGIRLGLPGYGAGEVPIGGALGFALFSDRAGVRRAIRLVFLSQMPERLRDLDPASPVLTSLGSARCATGGCAPETLRHELEVE